jgi:hypothetical protein
MFLSAFFVFCFDYVNLYGFARVMDALQVGDAPNIQA